MANQFSPIVSEILAYSRNEAVRLASSQVCPEHLLLGILHQNNNILNDLLASKRVGRQALTYAIEERIREGNASRRFAPVEPSLNEGASNILKLAVLEARTQHTQIVDVEHLILAILHDQARNGAREILEENDINYEDTLRCLQRKNQIRDGVDLSDDDDDNASAANSAGRQGGKAGAATKTSASRGNAKTPVLNNFSTDLTQAAADGKLDVVVGREKEILRVIEILCRRKKNNPVLIGEPGVGKSSIAEGLAQMIVQRHTSPVLFNKRIVSLNMNAMVAGTKYRGQFEERIQALLKELEDNPDIIVFIDEIHTIIGAGGAAGTLDAANIMKPALARGVIQCIGATTLDEYRNSVEKDGALERRFQKVLIEPTTPEQTLDILHNIKERYEQHHHVNYTEKALEACVRLTERYVTDRCFPDKAIDALDEVGAKVHIRHANMPPSIIEKERELKFVEQEKLAAVRQQNFEKAAALRDAQCHLEADLQRLNEEWTVMDNGEREDVSEKDVADVVSVMTGVPVQRISQNESDVLRSLGQVLKGSVIAQDHTIDKMVRCIQRNRIGLRDPNHPIGVFMFLGPTGVGKTYLAKKLAETMFGSIDALIRIDMSEYTESFNTSRLIGAPPGYVGYEEGGQLTERVRRHPYSIVLLDEIEKAHSNVFNLLLQVLDEGRLTDGNGRTIDFRNTVIIMTSNAGTRQLKEFGRGVGFSAEASDTFGSDERDKEHARKIIQKSLSKQFAPEFLNRLDEIITFDQLDRSAILSIVDIELDSLFKRVNDMGYEISISDEAKEFLATKGYDKQFGARPLKRAIQNYVEDGLCALMLSSGLTPQQAIHIGKSEDKEELVFTQ